MSVVEIIAIILILSGISAIGILTFFKKTRDQQVAIMKEWLKFSVVKVEKSMKSEPGQLKLRYVYAAAGAKFPLLMNFISFEQFSEYVDEALDWAKENIEGAF